jgi:hypothetical protein
MKIKDLLGDAYKEGMTLDEVETALDGIELPEDKSDEVEKLKSALSKSNSEASNYKKQLREKMDEDQRKADEDKEKNDKLQSDYDALLRRVNISDNKAKLLSLGYTEELASETAEAMVDGDTEKVFANQQKHLTAVEKKLRSDLLKDTPKPDGGNSSNAVTKEQLRGMSVQERFQYSQEHPEEYKQLYGGNA